MLNLSNEVWFFITVTERNNGGPRIAKHIQVALIPFPVTLHTTNHEIEKAEFTALSWLAFESSDASLQRISSEQSVPWFVSE